MKASNALEPAALQSLRLAELIEDAAKCFAEAIDAYEEHRLATDPEFRAAGGNSGAYAAPARIENKLLSVLKAAGLSRFDRQIASASDHGLIAENGAALRHFAPGHPVCRAAQERADQFMKEEIENRGFRERRTPIRLRPGERFLGAIVLKPNG